MSLILLTTILFSTFFHQIFGAPPHLNLGELRPSSCKEPLGCEFCNKFDECISCQNEYYFMQVGGEDSETVRCLENCFPHQFSKFVGNKQECIDCHSACVDGCTGPNVTISKGGCNKCLYGVMNGQTKTCLIKSNDKSSACEKGYFHEKATENYSIWTYHICLKCETACQTCESAGIHPVTNKCVCKNYLAIDYTQEQKKFCVEDCPSGYVEVLRSNEDPLCLHCNKDEIVDFSARKCSKQADKTETVMIGLVITTLITTLGLVMSICICLYRRHKRKVHSSTKSKTPNKNKTDTKDSQRLLSGSIEVDNLISQNYEKARILEHQLKLYKDAKGEKIELGCGYFGKVYKGIFIKDNIRLDVAIKVIEKDEPIREAMKELALCHALIPPYAYVNKPIGICDVSQKPLQIIYNCRKANLNNYCSQLKHEGKELDLWQMYLFCAQIANGMDYLANKHNIIHKNLMASSILIESADHVLISSFGLIRYVKNVVLRINVAKWPWLAIEWFNDFTFTKQTDIWSYGIVGWEIFENCSARPYKTVNIKNEEELKAFLTRGDRLPKPMAIKNKKTYNKLKECWSIDPIDRPSFEQLYEYFYKMALRYREGFNEVPIDESKNDGGPGVKFNLSNTSPQTESEDEPSSSNPASPAEPNDSEDSENETPADNFRKTNPAKHSEDGDPKKQALNTSIDSGLDEKCVTLKRAKTNHVETIVEITKTESPRRCSFL